jgi:hypothetical protein
MQVLGADTLSYGDFGEAFVRAAVTPERIVAAVREVAGDTIAVGPLRAGPGGAASVMAKGSVGEPVATEVDGAVLRYRVVIPAALRLNVRFGAVARFNAEGEIVLRLSVHLLRPLALVIDVEPVAPADVTFAVTFRGVPARLVHAAADVEGQMRQRTAEYVDGRVAAAGGLTRFDLLPLIESAWSSR